jgi:hypothetical protein
MIDGKPAGQVLSGMREDAARGTTPAQTYGADVAKRNIEERGPQAAIEDYFNRNRLDTQRAPMPTEPGSMAERRAAEGRSLMQGPAAPGPAQRAMRGSLDTPNVPYAAPDMDLAGAQSAAAGSRVLRTPTAGAQLQRPDLAMRSQDYVNAATGRVDSAMPSKTSAPEMAGPPLLARPRPQTPTPEAPPPALVQRTNEFADRLRDRVNTPYQQRMTEGGITIDDMTKAVGSVPGKARRGLQRVRDIANRTNQWAENFRKSR